MAEAPLQLSEDHLALLRDWAQRASADSIPIPFIDRLDPDDLYRFRTDLLMLLTEPEESGDAIDVREVADVLREFAELAGWEGPLWLSETVDSAAYHLDVAPKDLRALSTASPAVRRVVEELFSGPLIENPYGFGREVSQRVKKMPDRDLWQVYLPDGFRLRYYVDEPERTVHIVYLGPHSDSRNDGREAAVRQAVHRQRLKRRKDGDETGA